jgi:hypothetical protein
MTPIPFRAGHDDLVAHHEVVEIVELLPHVLEDLGRLLQPPARQVVLQSTRPDEREVHPRAGGALHERLDHLAFDERVEDRRHRAELERIGPHEHEMAEDPVPFGEHRSDPAGPLGHLDPRELLDGQHEPELVVERREPVVPVHEDEGLAGVAMFGELLRGSVHVTDDRLGPDDDLAVELEHQPEVDGCCGPMLRIISSVRRSPGETTSMSIPPPRTIQCSLAALKTARSSVSTAPNLTRADGTTRHRCTPATSR